MLQCIAGAQDEECISRQSAWPNQQQHQQGEEVHSAYHGDDPFAGEEGVSSTSRASLSESGFVSGPRAGRGTQRASSAPRDRPSFSATVPRLATITSLA